MNHSPISLILVLTLLLLIPSAGRAKLTLGPFLFINSTSFSGDVLPGFSYASQAKPGGGIMFDYYLKDDVTLSLQPMIVQKGSDLVRKRQGQVIDHVEFDLTYLSLPLALKVTGTSRSRMYVSGGLELNFLLDATQTDDLGEQSVKDDFESIELNAHFGVGGLIAVGSNYIFVEGRYTQGLSDILANSRDDLISIKTVSYMLLAGFLFQLGGSTP